MEDDQKNQNGGRPKKSKWKETKKFQTEDDHRIKNGRRPNKIKMEDDQKKSKWKTTK